MTDQSTAVVVLDRQPRSVLVDMSTRYGMEPAAFEATLRATVCKGAVSREEFAAFLLVAKEYRLNPLTKEIYAFPAKGGGIQPIVSIDGWCRIINEHPALDGLEFDDVLEGGALTAVTVRIYRKDRSRPTIVTEYMSECKRNTDVWKTWPARMLRHKALIQGARYAFGFSGIVDPDEYERLTDVTPKGVSTPTGLTARLAASKAAPEGFNAASIAAEIGAGEDANDDAIPDFDAETGEIVDAEVEEIEAAEPFPGDKPRQTAPEPAAAPQTVASASQVLGTLSARVGAFRSSVSKAPTSAEMTAIRGRAAQLFRDIESGDPDEVGTPQELAEWFDGMVEAMDEKEREGQA